MLKVQQKRCAISTGCAAFVTRPVAVSWRVETGIVNFFAFRTIIMKFLCRGQQRTASYEPTSWDGRRGSLPNVSRSSASPTSPGRNSFHITADPLSVYHWYSRLTQMPVCFHLMHCMTGLLPCSHCRLIVWLIDWLIDWSAAALAWPGFPISIASSARYALHLLEFQLEFDLHGFLLVIVFVRNSLLTLLGILHDVS